MHEIYLRKELIDQDEVESNPSTTALCVILPIHLPCTNSGFFFAIIQDPPLCAVPKLSPAGRTRTSMNHPCNCGKQEDSQPTLTYI